MVVTPRPPEPTRFLGEGVGKALSYAIICEDVVLQVHPAPGASDGSEPALVGGRSVLEQPYLVAVTQRCVAGAPHCPLEPPDLFLLVAS